MLSQVILASKTKFVYRFLQEVLESQGVNCYVADEGESFGFQIDELRPQVVLVNLKDLDWDWIKQNLNEAKSQDFMKVALVEQREDLADEVKNFFHHLVPMPVEPFALVKQLKIWQGSLM